MFVNDTSQNFETNLKLSLMCYFFIRSYAALLAENLDWIVGLDPTRFVIRHPSSAIRHMSSVIYHPPAVIHREFQLTGSDDFS